MANEIRSYTLDEWVNATWQTFSHNDSKRRPTDMWGSVAIYTSTIAEGLRKARYDEVFKGIAHTFIWIASFIAKCKHDRNLSELFKPIDTIFEDVVALMYPQRCGHCKHCPCTCSLHAVELEAKSDKKVRVETLKVAREEFRRETNYKTWRVDLWVDMIARIYENPVKLLPVEVIGFHLAEEVGEVAKAIRGAQHMEGKEATLREKYTGDRLQEELQRYTREVEEQRYELQLEIAQSFSWLCSLFLRIRNILEGLKDPKEVRTVHGEKEYVVDIGIDVKADRRDENMKGNCRHRLLFSDLLVNRFGANGGTKFICDNCGESPCRCDLHLVEYKPARAA